MAYGNVLPFGSPLMGMGGSNALFSSGLGLGLGLGLGSELGDGSNISSEAQQEPQQELMALLMMLAELLSGGAMGSSLGGSPCGGGGLGGGGFSPLSGLPGAFPGSSGGGSYSPSSSPSSSSSSGSTTPTGNPSQAVQIAQSHLGQGSGSFTFANYTHAGGTGNDCADFVSACVGDSGDFKKTAGDANVGQFQSDLQSQGWHQTTSPQPGDVAIVNGSQHAELVSGANGQCIGSNGGATNQSVSYDTPSSWGSVVYWAPPSS
jgi:hypothetical protein